MGGFGVKRRYGGNDGDDPKHYFSFLSSQDLSVSENLDLPFDKDDLVDGGSCGDLLYSYSEKGKIVIFNLENNESIVIPPPEVLTPMNWGSGLRACGVAYDAKAGDYKVIRIYDQMLWNAGDERYNYIHYFDLYSVLSGSAKEITRPSRKCCIELDTTSIYVGEAGSGSGSCYWVSFLYDRDKSDPLNRHVLSFDFATERFDQFPLPLPATTAKAIYPEFELVECRGSLGALVHWIPPDEFSTEAHQKYSSDLSIQLFVRNGNGKGTSWELLYDVRVADAYRPLGLKDDRLLFLAARPSGDGRSQRMVYYLASKALKKLDIYNCSRRMSVICYGDKRRKKKGGKGKGKKKKKGNHIPGKIAGERS